MSPDDWRWLDSAARIAMPWRGTTAENPTVGALVVSPDGRLLGRGVTARRGRPHAEPQALAMAGEAARGATLYVTLEPCAHWGLTPPCADAVIAAGPARVVIGLTDPDPRTAGSSITRIRDAGIAVDVAGTHAPSQRLHEGYLSRKTRNRPFVTLKLALSRDGMIGRHGEPNVAITGEEAQRWTHMQRALSDAVMVGAGTARIDRPRLSVRLPGLIDRAPLRVFLEGRTPLDVRRIRDRSGPSQATVVLGVSPDDEEAAQGRPHLAEVLTSLAERGVGRLLVEGGATLSDALLDAGFADRVHLLQSDIEIGGGGVRATVHASLPERLAELGYRPVAARALGCDRLTSFERP